MKAADHVPLKKKKFPIKTNGQSFVFNIGGSMTPSAGRFSFNRDTVNINIIKIHSLAEDKYLHIHQMAQMHQSHPLLTEGKLPLER